MVRLDAEDTYGFRITTPFDVYCTVVVDLSNKMRAFSRTAQFASLFNSI